MGKIAVVFPGQGAQKVGWLVTYIMKRNARLEY